MAIEPKVRPSMSIKDLEVIAQALDYKINAHVKAGDYANPLVLRMSRIKEYCKGFCTSGETAEQILAKYMAMQNTSITQQTIQSVEPFVSQIKIDNSQAANLTDEQRYDLLKLRDSSSYTEEENAFFLNKGTMIEMRRLAKKPVSADDL